MNQYYTGVVVLSLMALAALTVLVWENGRITREKKKVFLRAYFVVLIVALAEWMGVILNGAPGSTRELHIAVKCLDYCFTPFLGLLFIQQVMTGNRITKMLYVLLAANILLQIISAFTGWTYYVDADNYYYHGSYYLIYIIIYIISFLSAVVQFIIYGQKFSRQNRMSLYTIVLVLITGISIQELLEVRTIILTEVLVCILMFIHYSEYTQMQNDENMSVWEKMINTDTLTGLQNRHAYSMALDYYTKQRNLDQIVVFEMDINGLKSVNDQYGHEAGDELICGAADCISRVFGSYGTCYRTGGDEFVVIMEQSKDRIVSLYLTLKKEMMQWQGRLSSQLSISIGYACGMDHPNQSIENLIRIADFQMYQDKAAYYQIKEHDRRRNPR